MASLEEQKKKCILMENVVNYINGKVIALADADVKRNNVLLAAITDKIIDKMKQKDPLFAGLYKERYYGGSFYDNLKVGNPNEYDLDLILHIPEIAEPHVLCSDQPGFVNVKIDGYKKILERPDIEKARFEKLDHLLDKSDFLSTNEVLRWFEGVINKAINDLDKEKGKGTYVDAVLDRTRPHDFIRISLKMTKGAPAFTLRMKGKDPQRDEDFVLDIDLVPCFRFDDRHWPSKSGGYRENPSQKKRTFLVVPKKPHNNLATSPAAAIEKYWRLSFQEQERELIGDGKKVLKPSLRLLKKLRDKHNHKIASYFIKTVYLWAVEEESEEFWSQPLSFVLMTMLKKYEQRMRSNNIPYYWNKNYNLIEYLKPVNKTDIANTLKNIITDIERGLEDPIDPYVVGEFLLSKEEYQRLKTEVPLSKKQEKRLNNAFTSNKLSMSQSSVDSQSPLESLGFETHLKTNIEQYLERWEKSQRQHQEELVLCIRSMDRKLDRMLEDKKSTDDRMMKLEEKIEKLELENDRLRRKSRREDGMIDDILSFR